MYAASAPLFSSTFCRSLVLTFHLIWSNHRGQLCANNLWNLLPTKNASTLYYPNFFFFSGMDGSSNSDILKWEADRCSDNDLSLTPPTQKTKKNLHDLGLLRLFPLLSLLHFLIVMIAVRSYAVQPAGGVGWYMLRCWSMQYGQQPFRILITL